MISTRIMNALLPTYPYLPPDQRRQVVAEACRFVREDVMHAPLHLRLGVRALFLAMNTWLLLFSRLERPNPDVTRGWERLTGTPGRVAIRLVRSLAMLAYMEHPLVLVHFGKPTVSHRAQVAIDSKKKNV